MENLELDRVLCNTDRFFNPLHKEKLLKYQVAGVKDGYVVFSLALPVGMPRVFIAMLESLLLLFRAIDRKARFCEASEKVHDIKEIEEKETFKENFENSVLSTYDKLIKQEHSRKEAVKLTNQQLKAQNHPWASYSVIEETLRSAGRFRKKKGGD